jgi:hypothetical protein
MAVKEFLCVSVPQFFETGNQDRVAESEAPANPRITSECRADLALRYLFGRGQVLQGTDKWANTNPIWGHSRNEV